MVEHRTVNKLLHSGRHRQRNFTSLLRYSVD